MHQSIAGHNFLPINGEPSTLKVRDLSPRLLNDQRAGSGIPRVQLDLPEAVKATGRHVTEVQCGRPGPTDALSPEREASKVVQVILGAFSDIVGKAGDQQGRVKRDGARDAQRRAIQRGAPACLRDEELLSGGIQDDTKDAPALVFEPDRHAVGRKAMREIGGAVQRVDHPLVRRIRPGDPRRILIPMGASHSHADAVQSLRDEFRRHLNVFYARLKLAPPYHSVEKAITHLTTALQGMAPEERERIAADPALQWEQYR